LQNALHCEGLQLQEEHHREDEDENHQVVQLLAPFFLSLLLLPMAVAAPLLALLNSAPLSETIVTFFLFLQTGIANEQPTTYRYILMDANKGGHLK